MDKDPSRLASFLRHHAQRHSWSVADLSAAIHRSQSQMSRYLTGETRIDGEVADALAKALGLTEEERRELHFVAWLAQADAETIAHLAGIEARAQVADLCEAKVRRAKQYLESLGDTVEPDTTTPPDHHRKVRRQPSDTDQWMEKGEK